MKAELILPDFANALGRFSEALSTKPTDDLQRAGCIQYFEFSFDLAWKSIQAVAEHYGLESVKSPRVAFRTAFGQGWISEQEPWLAMLEARNRMSHVYSGEEALVVYESLANFTAPLEELRIRLEDLIRAG
jgi:nucleotidyltransferase substrate binding protein (TIGR01987 family)